MWDDVASECVVYSVLPILARVLRGSAILRQDVVGCLCIKYNVGEIYKLLNARCASENFFSAMGCCAFYAMPLFRLICVYTCTELFTFLGYL